MIVLLACITLLFTIVIVLILICYELQLFAFSGYTTSGSKAASASCYVAIMQCRCNGGN